MTPTITLDAGHCGPNYNPGAAAGYYESAAMWTLHQKVRKALEAYGFLVVQTRPTRDTTLDVVKRGQAAAGTALALSLHTNAETTGKADYPMGIYLVDDNCGAIDEESKEIARLLSGAVADVMGTTNPARIWTRSSAHDRDENGYNDDWYGFLRGAHGVGVPGVILECSFHTNPAAAAWLMVDANLDKLAQAIADALAEYYGMTKQEADTAPATPDKEGTTVNMNTLKKGSSGEQVKALQALLIGYGYDCGKSGVDGIFGASTDSAVRKYQSRNSLTTDGIVGPKTWAKLLGQ